MSHKPNLFIAGIAKCGTTSVANYLRQRPEVFISYPKELNYFTEHVHEGYRSARTEPEYLGFFGDCDDGVRYRGEASVRYCLSSVSMERIRQFNDEARIILLVRDPVAATISLHRMLYFGGDEDVADLERAWHLQEDRRDGRHLPGRGWCPELLQYFDVIRPAGNVRRALDHFPSEQVKVMVFDDIVEKPLEAYGDLLDFLGLPELEGSDFPVSNRAKRNRSQRLANLINRPPPAVRYTVNLLRRRLGIEQLGLGWLRRRLNRLNQEKGVKTKLEVRPGFLAEMAEIFRDEVSELGQILGRDLSHWSKPPDAQPSGAPHAAESQTRA